MGFQLSYKVIVDIFVCFEPRLEVIGEDLVKAFKGVKEISGEQFLDGCLTEIQSRQARNQLTLEISQKINDFLSRQNQAAQLAQIQVAFQQN